MAADAAGSFARLYRHETLHSLDRQVIFVQRHEKERSQRGQLHVVRPVRFHRDGTENARHGKRATDGDRQHAAREMNRLGQLFQNQQFLDLTRLDTRHISAGVNIRKDKLARLTRQVDTLPNHGLAWSSANDAGFVTFHELIALGQGVDQFRIPVPIHHVNTLGIGNQKIVLRNRIGIVK